MLDDITRSRYESDLTWLNRRRDQYLRQGEGVAAIARISRRIRNVQVTLAFDDAEGYLECVAGILATLHGFSKERVVTRLAAAVQAELDAMLRERELARLRSRPRWTDVAARLTGGAN